MNGWVTAGALLLAALCFSIAYFAPDPPRDVDLVRFLDPTR